MTHSTKSFAAIFLLVIILSVNSFAQGTYASASVEPSYTNNTITVEENNSAATAVATNPAINAKFSALFPNATNLKWTASADNFWVSFLNNGRKGNASFTAKGKMNYSITDCGMEQLPGAFSKAINKEYPSYHLFNAIEITAHNTVAYQAILENAQGYITLKYTADGVEEIQQVKKAVN
ncbi:MAG: hypothetical protein ABJB11_23545 [Ferruginibacter sp.]